MIYDLRLMIAPAFAGTLYINYQKNDYSFESLCLSAFVAMSQLRKTNPIYSFWMSPRSFGFIRGSLKSLWKLTKMLKILQKFTKTFKSWSKSVPKNQINRVHWWFHLKKQTQFAARRHEHKYRIYIGIREYISSSESRKTKPIQTQFRLIRAPASFCPWAGRSRW